VFRTIIDFSPETQQLIFADQAIQSGAVAAIQTNNLALAITDLSKVWAAIPVGSGVDDHSRYTFSNGAKHGQFQPSTPYSTVESLYHSLSGN
jgi:muramidase (phage lysozyme)